MTHRPDIISRIGGTVIEMVICLAIAAVPFSLTMVAIWYFRPVPIVVPDYHPPLLMEHARADPAEAVRYGVSLHGN